MKKIEIVYKLLILILLIALVFISLKIFKDVKYIKDSLKETTVFLELEDKINDKTESLQEKLDDIEDMINEIYDKEMSLFDNKEVLVETMNKIQNNEITTELQLMKEFLTKYNDIQKKTTKKALMELLKNKKGSTTFETREDYN